MWGFVLPILALSTQGQGYWFSDIQGLLVDLRNELNQTGKVEQNQTAGTTPATSPLPTSVNSSINIELLNRLQKKVAKFVPVLLNPQSTANLNEAQKKVLETLVRAAKYMDPIFENQVSQHNSILRESLERLSEESDLAKTQLEYMKIMNGPWDRTNNNENFVDSPDHTKPPGAGFYPEESFTAKKFKIYLAAHEDQRPDFESSVTVVEEPNKVFPIILKAIPYSEAYKNWLQPASKLLVEASKLTDESTLSTFLRSRADALINNNYTQSDRDWLQVNSRVQIAVGPHSVAEDNLMGFKASFGAFVYIVDQEFRLDAVSKYRSSLPAAEETESDFATFLPDLPVLERNLPIPENLKNKEVSKKNEINIAELVYAAGEGRKYVQPIAFELPRDENVRKELGTKKVLLRNVIEAKYEEVLSQVANRLMKQKQLSQGMLDSDAFFMYILYKELSRSLGPVYIGNNETRGEIKKVLGSSFAPLEEAKADVMGIFNLMQKFTREKWLPELKNKVLFTYIASLLRSVRFGVESAEGKAAAVQLNKYFEENSITLLPDGRFQVNFRKLELNLNPLIKEFVSLLHAGNREDVEEMFATYGELNVTVKKALEKLEDVAIDIKPTFQEYSSTS